MSLASRSHDKTKPSQFAYPSSISAAIEAKRPCYNRVHYLASIKSIIPSLWRWQSVVDDDQYAVGTDAQ